MNETLPTSDSPFLVIHGAAGFIGRALARELQGRYRLILTDRERPERTVPEAEFVWLDADRPSSIRDALVEIERLSGGRVRAWIDLAAADGSTSPSVVTSSAFFRHLESLRIEQLIF